MRCGERGGGWRKGLGPTRRITRTAGREEGGAARQIEPRPVKVWEVLTYLPRRRQVGM